MPLPQLPQDKANHVIYGAAIAVVGSGIELSAGGPPLTAVVIGAVAAAVFGALKELYDAQHRDIHTPEMADFVATTAGGLLVCVPTILSMVLQ
jgi:hypothetical protein